MKAKGLSFDKIAQELGVCKPTLLKWSQDYKKEIANLFYFQFETMIAQFRLERTSRIESMATILSKAIEALKSRSFDDLSSKELLCIIAQTGENLNAEFSRVKYITNECEDPIDKIEDELLTPKTLPFPY